MKIYFAGSIRGGRQDRDLYLAIINHLKNYGQVLTEHIGSEDLQEKSDQAIHNQDIDWLLQSDLLVAEVTTASLGVGYELGRALENNIPVITLFRPSKDRKLSAMIAGAPHFKNFSYTNLKEAKSILDNALN
jgi:nucleoside 2-deoxyribosyltransferase